MALLRGAAIAVVVLQCLALPARCTDANEPWQSLKHLTHGGTFTFVERDLTCHQGRIKAVNDQFVVVRTKQSKVTIQRSNLIRVRVGSPSVPYPNPYFPLLTLYSGRSSWADLMQFMPALSMFKNHPLQVSMSVATTDGKTHQGNLKDVTDSTITLKESAGTEVSLPKKEVSGIDYIRQKPLSDMGEYNASELGPLVIFDPELYPRVFHLGDTMNVRLYDRAIPEDDSPVQCK